MLHCPHCHAPITRAELISKRFLTPRTCRACGGGYFEGGTTAGIGLVAAGGALATNVSSCLYLPAWAIAIGAAALATVYTLWCQPRKVEELRSRIVAAVITAPVAAIIVLVVLQALK